MKRSELFFTKTYAFKIIVWINYCIKRASSEMQTAAESKIPLKPKATGNRCTGKSGFMTPMTEEHAIQNPPKHNILVEKKRFNTTK